MPRHLPGDQIAHIPLPSIKAQQQITALHEQLQALRQSAPIEEDNPSAPGWLRTFESGAWEAPSPEIVRAVFDGCGWTSGDVAKMIGKKDPRQVRNWKSGHSRIDYGNWRLLLIRAGVLQLKRGKITAPPLQKGED